MAYATTAINGIKCSNNSTTLNIGGETTLNDSGGISSIDTTIIVTDGSKFSALQTIKIDNEYITIGTINSNTFSNCIRAKYNSTASSHSDGSAIIGTYIGTSEINSQPDVMVTVKSDTTGLLYFDISDDDTNWNTYPTSGYKITNNTYISQIITKGKRYFRARFENNDPDGISAQTTSFNLNSYYGVFNSKRELPIDRVNNTIDSYTDFLNTRTILVAPDINNKYGNITQDGNNNLNVSINNSIGPFGTLLTGTLTPVIQRKFVAGTNEVLDVITTHDGATISASTGELICSSSTTTSSIAQYISKKIARYQPGQGVICRFTARFGTPVASTSAIIGIGNPSNGLFVGYNGTEFGFLRRSGGLQEVRKLQITNGADINGGTFTLTLNGEVSSSITVSSNDTIGEIVKAIYDSDIFHTLGGGWRVYQYGDSIYFKAIGTETRDGSYTLTDIDSGVVGTFSQTLAGSSPTDTWTTQSNWNNDTGDNTGTLPTLDFTKSNVFQIQYQWLGYGSIILQIEEPTSGKFIVCHKLSYANQNTEVTIKNPDLPFMIECDNKETTSNIQITSASLATFVVGELNKINTIPNSVSNEFASSTSAMLCLRHNIVVNSTHNNNVCIITGFTFGNENNSKIATFKVIKNAGLVGNITNWTNIPNSLISYNTEGTSTENGQTIYTTLVGSLKGESHELDKDKYIILHPGEIICVYGSIQNSSVLHIGISFYEEL